jgi:hypothetical protein
LRRTLPATAQPGGTKGKAELRPRQRWNRETDDLNDAKACFRYNALARTLKPGTDRAEKDHVVRNFERVLKEARENAVRRIGDDEVVLEGRIKLEEITLPVYLTPIVRQAQPIECPEERTTTCGWFQYSTTGIDVTNEIKCQAIRGVHPVIAAVRKQLPALIPELEIWAKAFKQASRKLETMIRRIRKDPKKYLM